MEWPGVFFLEYLSCRAEVGIGILMIWKGILTVWNHRLSSLRKRDAYMEDKLLWLGRADGNHRVTRRMFNVVAPEPLSEIL
jgi:hypothetical protein